MIAIRYLKIAFIEDGVYAYASGSCHAIGGAERDQWLLGIALANFGWSVIVGIRNGLDRGERRIINGVEFVGIGHREFLSWYQFLASEKPHWLFWECADHRWGLLVEIAKLAGVRTIFAAGCDLNVNPSRFPFHRPQYWRLYALGLSRTDKIFVQHGGQLSSLSARWQSKASVLPKVCILAGNGEDLPQAKPHSERKYVAWVGRLVEMKRPDILIDIARKAPAIQFVVCGGPTDSEAAYGKRIADELGTIPNIEYLGQVAPDTAQQMISDAAILLSSSDVEGFPNTFVQAWSSGTPIVSLKIDPDRIIDRFGLGAVSHNPKRAIEDMTSLITSTYMRDEIASRARQFVVENYSESVVVRLFERALNDVCL